MKLHPCFCNIFHMQEFSSSVLAKFHDAAYIILRNHNISLYNGFLNMRNENQVWKICRVLNQLNCSIIHNHLIYYTWRRCYYTKVKFSFKPLNDYFHMKKPQKSASESLSLIHI